MRNTHAKKNVLYAALYLFIEIMFFRFVIALSRLIKNDENQDTYIFIYRTFYWFVTLMFQFIKKSSKFNLRFYSTNDCVMKNILHGVKYYLSEVYNNFLHNLDTSLLKPQSQFKHERNCMKILQENMRKDIYLFSILVWPDILLIFWKSENSCFVHNSEKSKIL